MRDGLVARLSLWIQPRAARTEVAGRHGNAIRIRVAAPPVDGAANEELIRFLAAHLNVRRAAVSLSSGAAGRRKTVEIAGMSAAEAEKRLGLT